MKWMKDFGYVANLKMHKNTNKVLDYASKCVIMNNERVWENAWSMNFEYQKMNFMSVKNKQSYLHNKSAHTKNQMILYWFWYKKIYKLAFK